MFFRNVGAHASDCTKLYAGKKLQRGLSLRCNEHLPLYFIQRPTPRRQRVACCFTPTDSPLAYTVCLCLILDLQVRAITSRNSFNRLAFVIETECFL